MLGSRGRVHIPPLAVVPLKITARSLTVYLITAPKVLRLDASETVVVQLFGYNEESTFIVSLKSYPDKRQTFATQSVTLSSANRFQDVATLRLLPRDFPKEASYVYLEARSTDFTREEKVEVTRENGFLFIQTDKPLYNPEQSVKVRVFSLDEELRPALRPVTLTFIVSTSACLFVHAFHCRCGVWRIEATYTDDFSTQATAEFEVKEYVLPSISVQIQPEASYISSVTFHSFKLTVTARYVHGSPVSSAQVFLRFGYTEGSQTTIIPNTVTKQQLIDGFLEVSINVEEALKLLEDSGPRTLQDMDGKFLYVAVSLRETDGGISQEAELATVKFLQSPFTMALVATPPFIKPGLPYSLRVLVKDPLGQPVGQVPVKVRATMTNNNGEESLLDYSGTTEGYAQTSRNDGTAIFIYNMPSNSKAAVFTLETADKSLSPSNQAMLRHETTAYYSINKRYLYIDWASHYQELNVGDYITINVYFHHYSNIPLQTFSYQVISKGKIVKFDTVNRYGGSNHQAINFQVTPDMVPSARLLVYYIMTGENIAELVADSVWINVKGKCVNDLQMRLSAPTKEYSPKDNLALTVKAKHNSLVALSSIDTAIYNLKAFRKDPMTRVLRHIEQSDHGCGGGGGKDNADVFRLAGLTFMTNANAKAAQLEGILSWEISENGHLKNCCLAGIKTIPTLDTCSARARRLSNSEECKKAFRECCEFRLKLEHQNKNELQLARMGESAQYFSESGLFSLSKPLPDSLTTWEIKAVGMFSEGICVADALRVQVTQKVSLDVPLPYSMVRGEQVELRGSVYNQYFTSSWVTGTVILAHHS
uniref:Complement component 5 n=1 Tax=Scleropages formosus TaxID=113540 RepID=A0A8C9TGA1_SCLFO